MKRLSSIICIILIGADLMAQDAIHITAREGRIESLLKKKSPEQVESLVIDGTLNNTDLLYLSKLPNLRSLDISQAEMSKEFSKSLREQFLDLYTEDSYDSRVREGHYDGSNLYLSGFKELTDLSLGGRLFADSWTEYGIGTQSDLGNPRMSLLNDDGVPWYGFGYGHFQVLDDTMHTHITEECGTILALREQVDRNGVTCTIKDALEVLAVATNHGNICGGLLYVRRQHGMGIGIVTIYEFCKRHEVICSTDLIDAAHFG